MTGEIHYAARIRVHSPSHVIFLLFVGGDIHSRGLSGELCLRQEEFEDFKKKVNLEIIV